MQIVIDIPDVIYSMVRNTGTYGMYRFNSTKAIKNGTPLPEGHCINIPEDATNGDVIKMIFPNADTFTEEDCPHIVNISLGGYAQTFRDSWWNAPYRSESEEV